MYDTDNPTVAGNSRREFESELFRWSPRLRCDEFTDFTPGTALPAGWSSEITKTAGTPTVTVLANTANGVLQAALDATNELQYAGVDWGNQKVIPATQWPYFEARVQVPTALTSVQDVIIGLGTSYASPIGSIAKYVRFRLNGNMNVLVEGNDGTNTITLQAAARGTTVLAAGQFYLFSIDLHDLSKVKFWIDDAHVAVLNLAAFAATDLLQPLIGIQKTSGTTTPTLQADTARCMWNRI